MKIKLNNGSTIVTPTCLLQRAHRFFDLYIRKFNSVFSSLAHEWWEEYYVTSQDKQHIIQVVS
jgi:hypothetical protein